MERRGAVALLSGASGCNRAAVPQETNLPISRVTSTGVSMSDLGLIVTEGDAHTMTDPGIPAPPSEGKMPPPKLPPDSLPPEEPEGEPDLGPTGPCSPYPDVDPSINEPPGPGSAPRSSAEQPNRLGRAALRVEEGCASHLVLAHVRTEEADPCANDRDSWRLRSHDRGRRRLRAETDRNAQSDRSSGSPVHTAGR